MARSVSRHRHAIETIYLYDPAGRIAHEDSDHYEYKDDEDSLFAWEDFLSDIRTVLREQFPSLTDCDRWLDREDQIILENSRAEVSVSEYNNVVAVCLAPLDPSNPLDMGWTTRAAGTFRKCLHTAYPASAMISKGTFSNGEQAFAPLSNPASAITSKEGLLW